MNHWEHGEIPSRLFPICFILAGNSDDEDDVYTFETRSSIAQASEAIKVNISDDAKDQGYGSTAVN